MPNSVPGASPIVFCDVLMNCPPVVLADGAMFRCHATRREQRWHDEVAYPLTEKGTTLVRAGAERRDGGISYWVLSSARRLAITDMHFTRPIPVGAAVPGDAEILSVRLVGRGAEVLMSDGRMVEWRPSGWAFSGRMPVDDLILAGCERKEGPTRRWWCVSRSREVWTADKNLEDARSLGFIGSVEPILTLRLWKDSVEALCADEDIRSAFPKRVTADGDDPEAA